MHTILLDGTHVVVTESASPTPVDDQEEACLALLQKVGKPTQNKAETGENERIL
ncbi:hypothetical protein [Vogesella indigofera]|uniref:hypothetical protein n=1 Tax=Vogesella indigofera TaxID=45465 RepID=UPI00234FAD96|nr:hypothetical protein [Vogesella indigofera]MDC7707718.1 hypothetical protein [Vogesella indigofera]